MDEQQTLMTEVVITTEEGLHGLEPGSPEYERQAEALAKLSKARTEEIKAQAEIDDMEERRELEKSAEQRRTYIEIVKVGAMIALTLIGMGLKQKNLADTAIFEETGVFRTKAHRDAEKDSTIYKF